MNTGSASAVRAESKAGARRWESNAAVMLLGSMVAVSLLLWPTMASLHRQWVDTDHLTFLHGYLVLALTICFLWRAARSPGFASRAERHALLPLAVLSLIWLLAVRAGLELAHQLLWPIMLWVFIGAVAGWRAAKRCTFALALLYFAIPVWTLADVRLQSLSVHAVEILLRLTGIPSFVEGNVVHIPEGLFVIEGGCNGMHFLIVALAMAAVFGELHHDRWRTRLRHFVLAGAMALASNWIRIYVVILAGHLTEMQHYLVRVSHYYFGWAVFAVCMALFFWIVSRTPLPARTAPAGPVSGGDPATARMDLALAIMMVGAGPLLGAVSARHGAASVALALPAIEGWQGPLTTNSYWQPQFANHDRSVFASYRRADVEAQAFIAEYDEQRQGKEMVGYGNSLTHGLNGTVSEDVVVAVAGKDARRIVVGDDAQRSMLFYYYEVGNQRRVSGIAAQLTYGLTSLLAIPVSRIVSVRVRCAPDCDVAATQGLQLLDAITNSRARQIP